MTLKASQSANPSAAHDPGGKVRLALGAGVRGDASFSDDGRHRQRMRRWLGESFPERFIMFIGMNPSTADAMVDDPTCAREWQFAKREGFEAMVKCNIGDYRATDPKALLVPGVNVCTPENVQMIRQEARKAAKVIVCHGKLNKPLAAAAAVILPALEADGVELWCLGTNGDGSPKHPLYLRADTPLQKFTPLLGNPRKI